MYVQYMYIYVHMIPAGLITTDRSVKGSPAPSTITEGGKHTEWGAGSPEGKYMKTGLHSPSHSHLHSSLFTSLHVFRLWEEARTRETFWLPQAAPSKKKKQHLRHKTWVVKMISR